MSERKYGCHNRPRPTGFSFYQTQDGYKLDSVTGARIGPVYTTVWSSFGTTGCQYDKSATDAKCAGCEHAKQEAP